MARLVISDASPLIGLAIVDGLSWLPTLLGETWIPPSVYSEVLPEVNARGEAQIRAAIEAGFIKVWNEPIKTTQYRIPELDTGETDCIRLACHYGKAHALLVMDERAGRSVATQLGIKVVGTAAIIGSAKKRGLITSAKQCFATLHAIDFRIGATIIRQILNDVGEA